MNALDARPTGLHLHLAAAGPTLRIVLWFERPMEPLAYKTFKTSRQGDRPRHPSCASHDAPPTPMPRGFARATAVVILPCLGSLLPVPLPGLITAWDLTAFKSSARTTATAEYTVDAWVLPPEASLAPLRRLVIDWTERYGGGFVSPHALRIARFLDSLRGRLSEGPFLPTLVPGAGAWRGAVKTPTDWSADRRATGGWVPPVSLAELHRGADGLRVDEGLVAVLETTTRRSAPPVPMDAHGAIIGTLVVPRLAVFATEVLAAAAARAATVAGDVATDPTADAVFNGLREGHGGVALARIHAVHDGCLHPWHPVFNPPEVPPGHLHGRLHLVESPGPEWQPWSLELGLVNQGGDFLSLEAMVSAGTLHDDTVEQYGVTWFDPAAVIERDWYAVTIGHGGVFCRPELLDRGRCALSEAQAAVWIRHPSIMAPQGGYKEWLAYHAPTVRPVKVRGGKYLAFTAAPARGGAATLRVHWDLAVDPETLGVDGGPALHTVRFVPALRVAVGDAELLAADAEKLLKDSTAAFLRVEGRAVARTDVMQALELLHAREKVLQRLEAANGLSWSRVVELDDEWDGERGDGASEAVFAARWESFLAGIRDGAGVPKRTAPKGFHGTLRPYQERGLSWLAFLVEHGLGGCLADDMGLGKTVQVLALIATLRAGEGTPRGRPGVPDLVVCPTAVVINWAREARKFTPGLRVYVHQGTERARTDKAFEKAIRKADVVVTSYALVRRDRALIEARQWSLLVADEAQNLKNPDALQTRALKALPAGSKLALTGTPVENHLRDLWSIFDLAMPGLLGGSTRFAKTFSGPVRRGDGRALERLSKRVGPFLLRRTKRDPAIAPDLPEKQEQETFCELTREQVALYKAMTEATLEGIADKKGIARKAHILAALTRLKQICNHPENFQRDRPDELLGRSGKLDRLMELVGELTLSNQRAVIFTQFTEMGRILRRALDEHFGFEVDFYHGGLSAAEREDVLEWFNDPSGPPLLLVSLKAGGTGLNLTAASAVVHYDRWWNPAVEDQATDRTHRIGQTRSVNVYKFVTRGTLEERIVAMLEAKREMADRILSGSDDSWITEMDDRSLRQFLALDAGAEADDDDGR